MICLQTLQTWLYKLEYVYKDVCKDGFIDRYERSDMVKNHANFLKKMEKLKLFLEKFNENGTIRSKIYFCHYIVRDEDFYPIIIITYDKYIFMVNDGIQQV